MCSSGGECVCACEPVRALSVTSTFDDSHACIKLRPQMHLSLSHTHTQTLTLFLSESLTPLSQAFLCAKPSFFAILTQEEMS